MAGATRLADGGGQPGAGARHAPGSDPSVTRFRALREVLGLEFHVGPPRDSLPLDARRLERAVETAERALAASGQILGYADKARFLVAVYELTGEDRASAHAVRLSWLIHMIAGRRRAREATSRNHAPS